MDVTDVGSTAVHIVPTVPRRLTLQHFNNTDPIITAHAPHNSDARISNSPDWPSDMVFDVSYGCAALKHWGDPTFIAIIRNHIANLNSRGRGRGRGGGRGIGIGRGSNGNESCAERAARRARAIDQANIADSWDDYADVVLALWMQNATKRQQQAEAKKVDRTRDEVQKWLDSPQNQV